MAVLDPIVTALGDLKTSIDNLAARVAALPAGPSSAEVQAVVDQVTTLKSEVDGIAHP